MYTRNTIPPNRRWRDRRHLSLENRSYWSESIVFNQSAVQNDISLLNFHNTSSVFWCSIDGENIHFLRPFLDYRMYSSRGWSDKFIRFKARRIFHMCLLTLCFPILAFQGSSLVVVFTSPRITHSFVPAAGCADRWVTLFTCDIELFCSIGWLTHIWTFLFLPFAIVNSIEKDNKKMIRIRPRKTKD